MQNEQSEELLVDVPGGRVFVRRWRSVEPAHKPAIVLLHDSLGCVELWRDFPGQLAQRTRREVMAYDRLGFGRSSARIEAPSREFIEEEAETVFPSICQALGLDGVVTFGHSVGGAMAIAIAGTHAQSGLCSAVVTESAQAFVEERTKAGVEAAKQYFSDQRHLEKLSRYHGPKARWVLEAWTETWLDPGFKDWSLSPHLKNVRCPVLAVHGDNDEYGSVAFPNLIADSVSGHSRAVILGGVGHVPHRESPDAVLAAVAEFLSEVEETRDR